MIEDFLSALGEDSSLNIRYVHGSGYFIESGVEAGQIYGCGWGPTLAEALSMLQSEDMENVARIDLQPGGQNPVWLEVPTWVQKELGH